MTKDNHFFADLTGRQKNFMKDKKMAVRILRPDESIPRKTDVTWGGRYRYENDSIAKEIAQGEKLVDWFCWTLFGLSGFYFVMSLLAR